LTCANKPTTFSLKLLHWHFAKVSLGQKFFYPLRETKFPLRAFYVSDLGTYVSDSGT
jgi:hypothetical protein